MAAKTWLSLYITFSSPMEILLDTMLISLMNCRQCCNQHWWASTSLIYWVLWEGTHEPCGEPGFGFGGSGTLTANQDGKCPIPAAMDSIPFGELHSRVCHFFLVGLQWHPLEVPYAFPWFLLNQNICMCSLSVFPKSVRRVPSFTLENMCCLLSYDLLI